MKYSAFFFKLPKKGWLKAAMLLWLKLHKCSNAHLKNSGQVHFILRNLGLFLESIMVVAQTLIFVCFALPQQILGPHKTCTDIILDKDEQFCPFTGNSAPDQKK